MFPAPPSSRSGCNNDGKLSSLSSTRVDQIRPIHNAPTHQGSSQEKFVFGIPTHQSPACQNLASQNRVVSNHPNQLILCLVISTRHSTSNRFAKGHPNWTIWRYGRNTFMLHELRSTIFCSDHIIENFSVKSSILFLHLNSFIWPFCWPGCN